MCSQPPPGEETRGIFGQGPGPVGGTKGPHVDPWEPPSSQAPTSTSLTRKCPSSLAPCPASFFFFLIIINYKLLLFGVQDPAVSFLPGGSP